MYCGLVNALSKSFKCFDDADINDVAPDCSFCGISARELQKKSKQTLAGLKRILNMAWNDPTKDVIDRALSTWLKRCRLICYKHRLT